VYAHIRLNHGNEATEVFPYLGPEMIRWLLDWYARPEDRSNGSFVVGPISDWGTEGEEFRSQRGARERGTGKNEDYDE
jgi:hypothetical protein